MGVSEGPPVPGRRGGVAVAWAIRGGAVCKSPRGLAKPFGTALAICYYRERKKPAGERDPFFMEGGKGYEALEHLRDLAHFLSENYGVDTVYCAECGELVDDAQEVAEHEGVHAACDPAS